MPEALKLIFVFAFSASIGSFLNVCIWRIPNGLSIVTPASMCPGCKSPISFYDNIPILSYLILGGKCRSCSSSISIEYPLVELVTGLLGVGLFLRFGFTPEFFQMALFTAALVTLTVIDLHHRILPNVITLPGIPIGFLSMLILAYFAGGGSGAAVLPGLKEAAIDSGIGILIGGGILLLIAEAYVRLTGKEGMGGGDVKLLAMVGAFLGWKAVLFTLFVSSVLGSIIGGALMLSLGKDSKYAIPFGPFLSLGALVHVFFGPEIIGWYFGRLWGV